MARAFATSKSRSACSSESRSSSRSSSAVPASPASDDTLLLMITPESRFSPGRTGEERAVHADELVSSARPTISIGSRQSCAHLLATDERILHQPLDAIGQL